MLNTPPRSAFGNCMPAGAWPVSCIAVIACIDTPVAPIGWPFAFSPPDGFTGSLPSFARPALQHRARALARAAVRPIASYSSSSAMVKQSCNSTKDRSSQLQVRRVQRALPGLRRTLELGDVALADRQEVVDLHRGAEAHRLAQRRARSPRRPAPAPRRRRTPASNRCASAAARRTGSSRTPCGRTRSPGPCASARTDCPRRSCGSSPRSPPARRTGRRSAGNSVRRCARTRRRNPAGMSASSFW